MTFVITKPQQELVPIMTQISSNPNPYSGSNLAWSLDTPSKKRRRKRSYRCLLTLSFVVTAVLLLTLPYIFSHFQTSPLPSETSITEDNSKKEVSLVQGLVGPNEIAYYHQPAVSPTEENYHMVLLHGSAFTKEDWKTSGILKQFTDKYPSIAITALDLPVSADHNDLRKLLGIMRDEDLIEHLPISALVTPSASGKTISSWITDGSIDEMEVYFSLWVPVASFSVATVAPTNLQALQQSQVNVLAVYGNNDIRGKKVMTKLRDHAGAKLLQLQGGHPVYLDSPDAFVKAVGDEILAIR